jgi:hypothetical protein
MNAARSNIGVRRAQGTYPSTDSVVNRTHLNLYEVRLASLLKRDRIKDFFRFPVSGLFDGSMKLWFLRRRSVRCRLRCL